ncbi:hypothetical protein AFV9_gp44 [Betalipothrixvirus uzonense]|uniref:Uncharacterized protein n=1 Tax=Betalipothrixvirus uzonense TaxID=512792 RepID=B2CRM1_9VIRU|nr:hypothetical protein AFV9_gp44 [Acidianus filamentous virus 9]ACB37278.1 hypothetical protein [Acidianus filamentous virus 9]
MAEAILGFLGGNSIVSSINDIVNNIFIWLRKMFMTIWRTIVTLYYKIIDYFMKDPVGAITFIGELIVFLS